MQRTSMRCGIAVAMLLVWGNTGLAQNRVVQIPGLDVLPAPRTINLTLEQRHVIRELVKELKVAQTSIAAKVNVGDAIPDQVALQRVPLLIGQKVPQIKSHRIYVTREQIVIVDPQERKVIEVVD